MRSADDFYTQLLDAKRHAEPDYGGNVLPAARIYSSITSFNEVTAFQQALERMLESDDQSIRSWAVNLCLGFVVFYDAIDRPVLVD